MARVEWNEGGSDAQAAMGAEALAASPMLELVQSDAARPEARASTLVIPARRLFSADEKAVLYDFARGALAVAAFSIAAAASLPAAGAGLGLRVATGMASATLLGVLVVLLIKREGEHPLDWASRVSLCAAVTLWALLTIAHRLHLDTAESPRGRFLLLITVTFASASLGAAIARRLRDQIRRRVVLIDNARLDEAVRATGTTALDVLGPIAASDDAALLALANNGIDDAVIGHFMPETELMAISSRMCDAAVRLFAVDANESESANPVIGSLATRFCVYRRSAMSPAWAFAKRLFDIAAGLFAVVALSPVFLAAAIAVKVSSPGPIFFGQRRTGLRGAFLALKFRTMRVGAHLDHEQLIAQHGNMFKLRRDPRVTTVGRWLRRFSIDELPQLLQVITGEMSLVGPRPPMPEEVSRYTLAQLRRLGVKPGCTGLWQVSGRSDLPFDKWVELDARYIEGWSPLLELSILVKTVSAVLGGKGAY